MTPVNPNNELFMSGTYSKKHGMTISNLKNYYGLF